MSKIQTLLDTYNLIERPRYPTEQQQDQQNLDAEKLAKEVFRTYRRRISQDADRITDLYFAFIRRTGHTQMLVSAGQTFQRQFYCENVKWPNFPTFSIPYEAYSNSNLEFSGFCPLSFHDFCVLAEYVTWSIPASKKRYLNYLLALSAEILRSINARLETDDPLVFVYPAIAEETTSYSNILTSHTVIVISLDPPPTKP